MMFGPLAADRKVPTTATRDMGAVAARLLAQRSWAEQEELPVLGPEDLSMNDMAAIMSEVLGREIRYQQIPFEAFKERLAGRGMSESFTKGYVDMMRAKDEGMDAQAARAAGPRAPTTFRQWCEAELKPAVADPQETGVMEQALFILAREAKGPVAAPPVLTGELQAVVEAVAAWPEVEATTHWHLVDQTRVDGVDFYVGADELGHLHLDGVIHLATTPGLQAALVGEGVGSPFRYARGWTQASVRRLGVDAAVAVFRRNYDRLRP